MIGFLQFHLKVAGLVQAVHIFDIKWGRVPWAHLLHVLFSCIFLSVFGPGTLKYVKQQFGSNWMACFVHTASAVFLKPPANNNLQGTAWMQPCTRRGKVGQGFWIEQPWPLCEGTHRSLEKGPTN